MTYSINTSKYTAKKAVEINGILFKVRKITTDEQFTLTDIQAEIAKMGDNVDVAELRKLYAKGEAILFGLFDDPKKAAEVFNGVDIVQLSDIYKDIMENAGNAED